MIILLLCILMKICSYTVGSNRYIKLRTSTGSDTHNGLDDNFNILSIETTTVNKPARVPITQSSSTYEKQKETTLVNDAISSNSVGIVSRSGNIASKESTSRPTPVSSVETSSSPGTNKDEKCGGHLIATSGEITTPNYPNTYPYEKICKWVIEAPVGHVVELRFVDFDVEEFDGECETDEVHVRDGEDDSGSLLLGKILCGQTVPETSISSGRYMFIYFSSDYISVGGRGFKAIYTTKPVTSIGRQVTDDKSTTIPVKATASDKPPSVLADSSTTPPKKAVSSSFTSNPLIFGKREKVARNYITDSTSSTKQSTTKNTKKTKDCGGRLIAVYGEIATPNYPNTYPYAERCEWVIEAPVGHVVELKFIDFDVEENDGKCDSDEVHVRDGEDESAHLLTGKILCGQTIPEVLVSSGRYMLIYFHSSFLSMGGRGFKAIYVITPVGEVDYFMNKESSSNISSNPIPSSPGVEDLTLKYEPKMYQQDEEDELDPMTTLEDAVSTTDSVSVTSSVTSNTSQEEVDKHFDNKAQNHDASEDKRKKLSANNKLLNKSSSYLEMPVKKYLPMIYQENGDYEIDLMTSLEDAASTNDSISDIPSADDFLEDGSDFESTAREFAPLTRFQEIALDALELSDSSQQESDFEEDGTPKENALSDGLTTGTGGSFYVVLIVAVTLVVFSVIAIVAFILWKVQVKRRKSDENPTTTNI